MAYTEDDLSALQDALASPDLRVQIGDQEVTFRSVYELRDAIRLVEADLKSQKQGTLSPRWRQSIFSD